MSTAYTHRILLNNLSTLPTEIVHEILDDLQVCDLLDLLTSSGPTPSAVSILISRIYSHLHFGRVFQSGQLEELSGYAALYLHAQFGPLKNVATLAVRKNHRSTNHTYEEMRASVIAPLLRVFENVEKHLFFPRQQHWAHTPKFPNSKSVYIWAPDAGKPGKRSVESFGLATAAEMTMLWDVIAVSYKQVSVAKSRQVRRAAELLEQYPQMLCQTLLDSQEPRTASAVKHRLQQLRETADNVDSEKFHGIMWTKIDSAVPRDFYGSWFFRQQRFPWVPFDKYLRMMMKILHRFPVVEAPKPEWPALSEETVPAKSVSSTLSYAAAASSGPPPRTDQLSLVSMQKALPTLTIVDPKHVAPKHIYPPQILTLMNTITAGLNRVYPRPRAEHEPLLTTLNHLRNGHRNRRQVITPTLETEKQDWLVRILSARRNHNTEWAQPNFVGLPKFDHLSFVRDWEKERVALVSMPFDDRELEWLDAFCRVCAYFLKTGVGEDGVEGMGAVMWNKDSTVEEYWRPRMEKA